MLKRDMHRFPKDGRYLHLFVRPVNALLVFIVLCGGAVIGVTEMGGVRAQNTVQPVSGDRFVECDACGLCLRDREGNTGNVIEDELDVPGNWRECAMCLYEETSMAALKSAYDSHPTTGQGATTGITFESLINGDTAPNSDLRKDVVENGFTMMLENRTTLRIEDGAPPEPEPGRYYTILGCVDINFNNESDDQLTFQDQGAVPAVVNFLLENVIYTLAGALGLGYLIYGSYIIMTAKGDPIRLGQGRSVVIQAIIGLVLLFSLAFILNLIATQILRLQIGV